MQSHESSVYFPCSFGFDKLRMVLQARGYDTGRFMKRKGRIKMLSISKAIRYFGHFTLTIVLVATIGCGESEADRLSREGKEMLEEVEQESREAIDELNADLKRINGEDY